MQRSRLSRETFGSLCRPSTPCPLCIDTMPFLGIGPSGDDVSLCKAHFRLNFPEASVLDSKTLFIKHSTSSRSLIMILDDDRQVPNGQCLAGKGLISVRMLKTIGDVPKASLRGDRTTKVLAVHTWTVVWSSKLRQRAAGMMEAGLTQLHIQWWTWTTCAGGPVRSA